MLRIKYAAHKTLSEDFKNFYRPSDDLYGSSGSGDSFLGRPSLTELQKITEQRIGPAWRAVSIRARDAVRNQFQFIDYDDKVVKRPEIFKFLVDTDAYNQFEQWMRFALTYGTAFLISYWDGEDISKIREKPPNRPPDRFQAIPPTFLSPTNLTETNLLNYNEDVWEFTGGIMNSMAIHRDRVHVFTPDPCPGDWRGYSILEHAWLSFICYFNAVIYLVRGLAKWGNLVPVLKMGLGDVNSEAFDDYLNMMVEMQANYFYLLGKDDDLSFPTANVGQGMSEIMEILKEDIASGVGIPLNILFGRSTSGGLGSQGALVSERNYLTTLAGDQAAISDNVLRLLSRYFDVEGLRLDWKLALQKTTEQMLSEEAQELQEELLKVKVRLMREQGKQMKIQSGMLEQQQNLLEKMPDNLAEMKPDAVASDFVPNVTKFDLLCKALSHQIPNYTRGAESDGNDDV